MKKLISILIFIFTGLNTATAQTETYTFDTNHSTIGFSVRHFMAKAKGIFKEFEGTLTVDRDDLTKSSVVATIKIPSVDTANHKRDKHLQEDDYFDAENFHLMAFESTKWEKTNRENHYKVTGNLTIRGITKSVPLNVELLGFGEGRKGTYLSGWEATATINRNDWGVSGGKPAVGNKVEITINIEAHRTSPSKST